MDRPSDDELVGLLPVLASTEDTPEARAAALRLYLFLPVSFQGFWHRSSLEALLTDARGAGGRDLDTATLLNPDHARSWLSAMGYLALVDQISKLLQLPPSGRQNRTQLAFERLLIRGCGLTGEEAAAIYALRCSVVHSYGLLNDPRERIRGFDPIRDDSRVRPRLHMFRLSATRGPLVQLGDRLFPIDVDLNDLPETTVDLWTLADVVEALVDEVRRRNLDGSAIAMRPQVPLAGFVRACFFAHQDPIVLADGR